MNASFVALNRIARKVRALLVLGVFAGLVPPGLAQHEVGESTPAAVTCIASDDDEMLDLGLTPPGSLASRLVTLGNVTRGSVHLRVGRKTCGCIEASLSKEVLAAGEEAVLSFGTVVPTLAGRQQHSVEIEAWPDERADGPRQLAVFSIAFEADVDFVVKPLQLNVRATRGRTFVRKIFVRPNALAGLEISHARSTIPGVRIEPPRILHGRDGQQVSVLDVTGQPSDVGFFEGVVEFRTNSTRFALQRLPIRMRVDPDWESSPPAAVFVLGATSGTRAHLGVREVGRDLVGIHGLRFDGPAAFNPRVSESPGHVVIDADPGALADPTGSARLSLLDEEGVVRLEVPVVWWTAQPEDESAASGPNGQPPP